MSVLDTFSLEGQVALVTGAAQGLGAAAAPNPWAAPVTSATWPSNLNVSSTLIYSPRFGSSPVPASLSASRAFFGRSARRMIMIF